jgi:23S rRNA (adenine2503-C2)-methyltransferase
VGNDWFYCISYFGTEIGTWLNELVTKLLHLSSNSFLLGLSSEDLEEFARREGEQAFRGRQIHEWIYQRGAKNLDSITVLPKKWRDSLQKKGIKIGRLDEIKRIVAQDSTLKLLMGTVDNEIIETVGIPTDKRLTVCVSSQIGCPMGCRFCATGKGGLIRSLDVNEIVDQVISVRETMNRRPTHVVFMGMGEPLLNIRNVLDSIECLTKDIGIGQRKITVSTVGIPDTLPDLAKLAQERLGRVKFTLAVSLHAPNQDLRKSIIPSASAYPITLLLKDCKRYVELTGRRVSFEYILLGGLNDKDIHAEQLANLVSGFQSHVNLIAYNPIAEEDFKRPSQSRLNSFRELLENKGVAVSVRASRGRDKDAACGQLRRQQIDKMNIN